MSSKHKTQRQTKMTWVPDPSVIRIVTLQSATVLLIIFATVFGATSAAHAQFASTPQTGASDQYSTVAQRGSAYRAPQTAAVSETTYNQKCVQKTFKAPTEHDADLVGTFIQRLLSDELRKQTTWRYNEKDQTITVYGPEKSIEITEKFLNDFSEPLFEAFLNAEEYVGVAGVAAAKPSTVTQDVIEKERPSGDRQLYDPEQNDFVKIAYEPQGALTPDRREYAVAFGGGSAPQANLDEDTPTLRDAAAGNLAARRSLNNNDDLILDVATYRCSPATCDRVAQLAQKEFAANPEVAIKVDPRLGVIIVHTNRKTQREVRAYLAKFQVYPARPSAYEPDLRVATGIVAPINGNEGDRVNVALGNSSLANAQTPERQSVGTIADVYYPQYRKVEELQDSLLQLFGDRLTRVQTNSEAPFSERQVVVYRFVKRNAASETSEIVELQERSCEISINALKKQITVDGDSGICTQMLALLRAMDQPPLQNGNVRRFIPIRNGDARKIRQIFEYDAGKRPATAQSPISSARIDAIARELCSRNLPEIQPFACEIPLENRLAEQIKPFENATVQETIDLALSRERVHRPLDDAMEDVANAVAVRRANFGGVRQVAYQDDLGDLTDSGFGGPGSGGPDFGGPGPGGPGFGRGVGVVQDFTPIVLDNIDVVVVDNATDAEFQRIRQMIEQIEELAKIAEISTEIYNLEHVDCVMLHGVLTTLHAEMFATKQGRVVFYALQNPNALLIAGWGQAFEDMKNLVQLFDQPIADGAGSFRVTRLKYASADEIATLLTDAFTLPTAAGSSGFMPRIRVFADVRANSLVIQASPNDWQEIQKILVELDVNKADTKLVTKIIPLKNSLAENIRTIIQNVIISAKQGTLDTTAAKFPILQLFSVDSTGKRLVESGIMMDVDVVADAFHNQLIVTAPEDCVEFMERLVELLDIAPKKAQIRFFQIRYGDAQQILQTLQTLLATADDTTATPTLPQADEEESFVPVRFAMDTRTNVIIAAAAPKELAIVDALIVALDIKDTAERKEEVVQLRNIQAMVVAEAIDNYLSQKQTLETASEVLSNYQLFEQQVIVIPEAISNSIIVSASPDEMEKILEMIKTFDKDPPQVQIQVLIAEVTLSNQEEFGIESGLQNSASFDRSMITSTNTGSSGTPGFDIIGNSGPGKNMASSVNPTNIAGQVLNNFAMGASDSSLGYGGFVVSASSRSVQLTLRALREKNRLQVLSRPQVTAMDNQQAFILVGQRVPRISGTNMTNYGVQMNATDTPVGLILLVTPRVTSDGRVVMEIGAEKSSLGNDSDATPIYSNNGEVVKSRSIDTIQTMTAISARDGETVMLGGLLTSTKEKISRGVPYVSDLPVVGWLFRYDQEVETRKELLIVMTPRIMRKDSNDFNEVLRVEMNKTHINLDEAMSMNGNMGLYDPSCNQGYQDKKTKRLLHELVHPDKMDELNNLPPYSPSNDYRPRPTTNSTNGASNSYSMGGVGSSAPSPASAADAYAAKRRYTTRPTPSTRSDAPSPSNSILNKPAVPYQDELLDDEFLLDDAENDFSANARLNRPKGNAREPARIAMRSGEGNPDDATNARRATELERQERAKAMLAGTSTPNSSRLLTEQTVANASRADDLRATANKSREDKTSNADKEEGNERLERSDAGSRTIFRGQAPTKRATPPRPRIFYWIDFNEPAPYQSAEENSSFKLFRWTSFQK